MGIARRGVRVRCRAIIAALRRRRAVAPAQPHESTNPLLFWVRRPDSFGIGDGAFYGALLSIAAVVGAVVRDGWNPYGAAIGVVAGTATGVAIVIVLKRLKS